MPSRLSIRLLGSPAVERDSAPIGGAATQRRVLALLGVLGADRNGGVPRDRLIGLLWPEAQYVKGRHALAQLVYHTRRVLGEPGLIAGVAELRLDATVADVDVVAADAALEAGDDAAVARLHRGPLLDGFYLPGSAAFEQWLDLERRRRLDEVRGALDRLASDARASGQTDVAIEWLTRRITLDPLDSVAVERLATCLIETSAPADAVRVVDTHERILRTELDVALPPVLVRLRDDVRQPRHPPLVVMRPSDTDPAVPTTSDRAPAPTAEPDRGAPGSRAAAPVRRPLPSPARRVGWVTLPVAAAAVLVAWWAPRDRFAPSPPAAEIAIAPFRSEGMDRALGWLSEGLVELLSTRLEEASGREVLDAGRATRAWRGLAGARATAPSADAARAFGAAAPARFVVTGSATGDARRLVLDARLVRVSDAAVVATGSVTGPVDSIDALAARLAMQLATVAQRVPAPTGPAHPLAAVRHYLAGRDAERRGALSEALVAYDAALDVDSAFAEAAVRLAWVAWRRNAAETHDRAIALAWSARERLSPDDRALITALAGPRYPAPAQPAEQRAAWEIIASRTPDLPDAWRGLGLLYLSHGTVLGMDAPFIASRHALERALALDGADASTWRGLAAAVIASGDTTEMRRLLQRLPSPPAMPVARALLAAALRDRDTYRTALGTFASRDAEALRDAAMAAQHGLLPSDAGQRALALLAARQRTSAERLDVLLAQHSAAVHAGDEARRRRVIEGLDAAAPGLNGGRRLLVLDALVLGRDTAAARTAMVAMTDDLTRPVLGPLDAAARLADRCVLALAWGQGGRRDDARAMIRALRQSPPPVATAPVTTPPTVCADIADAALAVAERSPSARRLVAAVDQLSLSGGAVGDAARWADVLVGRWYAALGDPVAAVAALRRRPFLDGWPRYRDASIDLETSLVTP